jgi:hypothetical protein
MVTECNDCNINFEKDDTVYVCQECDEPVCKDCKEKHCCLDEPNDHTNETCCDCGDCQEEMVECAVCNDVFCSGCIDKHMEAEKKDHIDFEEFDYGEYAKEKICEKL